MTDRFKPSRAGVINVWDYVDEEWAFADGRLALRGHNGSGKTKALEVLFPFVLDGVADSRRLDPFSGENRTMKSNLLYRGQESEYGYVWMEFARARSREPQWRRPAATERDRRGHRPRPMTLIIGMRAHRNTDGVRMSFFVTGKRVGVDFGLLSADSRPLTERQLRAVLEPDAWRRTATEYRDLVDHRLFGLGRERYAQLLDLLLALRRPLLAKDLDPAKVSDTLTAGLSPVDDDLVQQAARDFENLAAVQKLFDDLMAANAAVAEFRAALRGLPPFPCQVRPRPGAGQVRRGGRPRRAAERGRRRPPPRRRGRTRGRGRARGQQDRRRAPPGPPRGPEELRGVQGPGPHRGQAPRGRRPGRRGRPPARRRRLRPPPRRRPGGRGGQALPPRRRLPRRRRAARRRPGRRRPALRHRRRRLRPDRPGNHGPPGNHGARDSDQDLLTPPAPASPPAATTSARSAASSTRSATPARSAPTPTRS